MAKLVQYAVGLFVRPRTTLRALRADPRRVGWGLLGILALAAVYFAGISVGMALDADHLPQFLVLNIPAEQYYAYERFFILPVALAGTILASGAIRLVARPWRGQGLFEDHFALLGFGFIVIAVVMGLPDMVLGLLVGTGYLDPPGFAYIGPHVWLGTLWYLLLMILAVKEVEGLPWGRSIALALVGFAANGLVQFIFIR